jgi:uncharacterized repeat protein (TIGR02543 family)
MLNVGRWIFRVILVITVVAFAGCPLAFNFDGGGSSTGLKPDPSSPHLTKPIALAYSEQGGTSGTIPDGGSFVSPLKTTITLSTETEHAVIYYTIDGSPLTTLTSASKMGDSHGTITLDPSIALQTLDIHAVAIGPSMLPSTVVHALVSVSPYPVLSITRDVASATEDGGTATFTITASRAPATDITINLLTGGNYEAGDVAGFYPAGTRFTRTLLASTTTVTIPITGQPDLDVDDDTITLTIQPDTISPPTYSVAGAANAQAQVVIVDNKVARYTVTYRGNGSTVGTVPTDTKTYVQGDPVTAAGQGMLSRTAYHFGGWNTQADGTGTNYTAGQTFAMGNNNLTLYANWLLGIEKTAGTGIRFDGTNPAILLSFLAVKSATEDRSALEYNLTGLSYPVSSATLDIYISNLDPGLPDGVMEFYTYAGDGVIDTSEFSAGSLYTQVTSTGDSFTHVDFTAAVNMALQNGWTYLGVRISTATADRYWIGGSIVGLPEPILTVVQ